MNLTALMPSLLDIFTDKWTFICSFGVNTSSFFPNHMWTCLLTCKTAVFGQLKSRLKTLQLSAEVSGWHLFLFCIEFTTTHGCSTETGSVHLHCCWVLCRFLHSILHLRCSILPIIIVISYQNLLVIVTNIFVILNDVSTKENPFFTEFVCA